MKSLFQINSFKVSVRLNKGAYHSRRIIQSGIVLILLLATIISPLAISLAAPALQETTQILEATPSATPSSNESVDPAEPARLLLDSLTPEERVGQLFLITFLGTDTGPESQIFDLITNYHVGGVVLLADNDNISLGDQTPGSTVIETSSLIRQLQTIRWEASRLEFENPTDGELFTPSFIPLFVGLSQEGDGYAFDQIINDLTTLPNQMVLGATWNPEYARKTAEVLGNELSALGVNFLMGPALDILEVSRLDGANNLGTRTFGGDPFWVGEMGKAFIEGIHAGSQGSIAVIAKHFPGHGGSDRLPEDEVATVRKTLDQLKSFELKPFFAVTGNAQSTDATTDGLLTSHIRYQGFQGNIRATTRPVSFDPQALNLLMELPELEGWRANGGLLVSDDLGSLAIRRFYELTNQPFDMPRRVALNAFLAGNDVLDIADFSSSDLEMHSAATQTLEFFAQKYREDPAFAQRVDESVLRILSLKYRLTGDFSLLSVIPSPSEFSEVGNSSDVTFEAARKAATLISPTQIELDEIIPDPPDQNDRIVFISDMRSAKQCSDCPEQTILDYRMLEEMVMRRYGPQAGGQVTRNNMISYPLSDLEEMLSAEEGDFQIERSLQRANWIVYVLLDNSDEYPAYQTLKQFLTERPDLFQQKRLIVFALNAPYFLDATNISKLTAYYGLYGKTDQSVDTAAYLLFKEQIASGASPVSIPGTSYDINQVLFPHPDQVIPIELDMPVPEVTENTTPEPVPTPEYKIGDVISVRTGIIFDHNGNPVPDDTPVQFILKIAGEPNPLIQIENTERGLARTNFTINTSGAIEISAESEPAKSEVLRFDIPPVLEVEEGTTPQPTQQASLDSTVTPTIPPTITATPQPDKQNAYPPPSTAPPKILYWVIAVALSTLLAWVSYRLAVIAGESVWGVRVGFLVLMGGLLAYMYLALLLAGVEELTAQSMYLGVALMTILGAAGGVLLTLSWRLVYTLKLRRDIPHRDT